MHRGKLIVIEGTDGSGKATQARLLEKRLEQDGYPVKSVDFPQYGQKSAGLVEDYLNGRFGAPEEVTPYQASIFYAADRFAASSRIRNWLESGYVVLANRYTTSNMGHQGGKLADPLERERFFDWVNRLEYELFNIPHPDLILLLYVEAETAYRLVGNKPDRDYIASGENRDRHEKDIHHLRSAEQTYLELARLTPEMRIVSCTHDSQILSPYTIHRQIWREIRGELHTVKFIHHNPNFLRRQPLDFSRDTSKIKIKRLSKAAKLPVKSGPGNNGLELFSGDYLSLLPDESGRISTGLHLELPGGLSGLVWAGPSGLAKGLEARPRYLPEGYSNELSVEVSNTGPDIIHIAPGRKIACLHIQKNELPEIIQA